MRSILEKIESVKHLSTDRSVDLDSEEGKLYKAVLQATLEKSKTLSMKRCDVQKGAGDKKLAIADFLPDLAISSGVEGAKKWTTAPDITGEQTTSKNFTVTPSVGLKMGVNLLKGGASVARLKSALYSNKANAASYAQDEGKAIADMYKLVLQITEAKIMIEITNIKVRINREFLKATLEKLQLGEVDRTEVAYTEAKLAKAEAVLAEWKIKASGLEGDFERWTGISAEEIKNVYPDFEKYIPDSIEKVKAIAARENPGLKKAKFQSQALKKAIQIEEASALPKIDLSAELSGALKDTKKNELIRGTSQYGEETGGKSYDHGFATGLSVTIPLDYKGVVTTKVGGARHDHQKSVIEGEKGFSDMNSNLETNFFTYKTQDDRIKCFEREAAASGISVQAALQEMLVGAKVYTQVINHVGNLIESIENLSKAQQAKAVAAIDLLLDMGLLNAKTLGVDLRAAQSGIQKIKTEGKVKAEKKAIPTAKKIAVIESVEEKAPRPAEPVDKKKKGHKNKKGESVPAQILVFPSKVTMAPVVETQNTQTVKKGVAAPPPATSAPVAAKTATCTTEEKQSL
jgi:outer membrane protein